MFLRIYVALFNIKIQRTIQEQYFINKMNIDVSKPILRKTITFTLDYYYYCYY